MLIFTLACLGLAAPALAGGPTVPSESELPAKAGTTSAAQDSDNDVRALNLWLLAKAGTTIAAQPATVAPSLSASATTAVPTYTATAAPTCADNAAIPTYPATAALIPNPYFSKADHLHAAAEHLEAAGRGEEARRVRLMEAEERSRLESTFIKVDLRMIELPRGKLAQVSAVKYGGAKGTSVLDMLRKLQSADQKRETDNVLASPDPKLLALIEALLKDHLAVPRAEPSMMVAPGRSAYVLDGGEIGYVEKDAHGNENVRFKEYGTRADVLATLLPDNRIHVDLRFRVSEPDVANSIDGVPAVKSREIETGLDRRSGQTVIVGGLLENRSVSIGATAGEAGKSGGRDEHKEVRPVIETVETMVMMRAEIVKKELAAKGTTTR